MLAAAAALVTAAFAAAPAQAEALLIPPQVFHGQWSVAEQVEDCAGATTAVFTNSGGFAATMAGHYNRLEGVGTWNLEDDVLVLAISELIAPGQTTRVRYRVENHTDDLISLADVATGAEGLLLHRCPD